MSKRQQETQREGDAEICRKRDVTHRREKEGVRGKAQREQGKENVCTIPVLKVGQNILIPENNKAAAECRHTSLQQL